MARKTVEFFWDMPDDIVAFSNSGQFPGGSSAPGIPLLPVVSGLHQFALVANVRDESEQPVGIISELEVFSDQDSFDVYLTAVLPGRGTLMSYQTKSKSILNEVLPKILDENGEWNGEMGIVNTTGPEPGKRAALLSATGEFQGFSGFHQQTQVHHHISPTARRGRVWERFFLTS